MEIVTAVITPIVKTLMDPVTKHLSYLISCTKYVRNMGTKMRELEAARSDVDDHMKHNRMIHLEIPTQVQGWLEEVRKINARIENVPNDVASCINLKNRHKIGRLAFKISEDIDSATRQHSLINWTDDPIPLGRVDSVNASTSKFSSDHNDFQSRDSTFKEALKALEANHKSFMVALWGKGGVGKTTMMQKLKNVVKEMNMFQFIVEVVIGEKTDPIAIQEVVANYLGIDLKERTKLERATKLRKCFEVRSNEGKNRILLILDDVWQFVDLNDIGLSPSPNQGVNFKVLLTTRDRDVCTLIGVEANSILNVEALTEEEAQSFFRQFVEVYDDLDPQLSKIGEDIVRKCCGLPIAIKTMACTLRNRSKEAWNDALSRLQHHDIHKVVAKVFEMSYENLQDEETKSTFLLCGMFPEDFDIALEDLVRYGWGLKLFNRVYTIREARNRLNTCIERLVHTNMLIKSDHVGCIKMHDLALAFALDMFTKSEHASLVDHGNILDWPTDEVSRSCKRVSLTCTLLSEFPKDLKFPNISILKLMHGDKWLRFSQEWYGAMEKLQVVSYDKMQYPLLPSSAQCSTSIRVLCLHQCSLVFDFSSIGNLLNLEVLSVANSRVEWLPSTVGNLTKLRLLDMAGCFGLRIDNGVLKKLVKLEELYMSVDQKAIRFTDENCNELVERSKTLSTLEFEFFENKAQPKNVSFEKLERFKISMGRYLGGDSIKSKQYSFENTLKLVTDKGELLGSGINILFEKTTVLCLSVDDMNDLEDVEVKSPNPPQFSSFYNLRVLVVSKCTELKYLFTPRVAKCLPNLEHLEVDSCPNMEVLIHIGSSEDTLKIPMLKFLSFQLLPKLSSLCHNIIKIELPQLVELKLGGIPNCTSIYPKNKLATSCFLKEEVVIPKLEKLHITDMENLKEIWSSDFSTSEDVHVSLLRVIEVSGCDNLVNLFPCNPMPLLHHLEELKVNKCGSLEVLFHMDLDCVRETGEDNNSSLRFIRVNELRKLREVWRVKGANKSGLLVRGFQTLQSIKIDECEGFRNVFTPTTTNFDLGALSYIAIESSHGNRRNIESVETNQKQEISVIPEEETSDVKNSSANVAFPSCLIHTFHNLRYIRLIRYRAVDVVFEIESPGKEELVTTHDSQQSSVLENLENLTIVGIDSLSHVWKFDWNEVSVLQKQRSYSPFYNLTSMSIRLCNNIKYLFSPLMAKLLSNLKNIEVGKCDGIEELVSERDDNKGNNIHTHTSTTLFPHLDYLHLSSLSNFECIGGGGGSAKHRSNELTLNDSTTTNNFHDQRKLSQLHGASWSLCQYLREIEIYGCTALSTLVPTYAVGQMKKLEVLSIWSCNSMKEVFETQGINNGYPSANVDEGYGGTPDVPRLIAPKFSNLKMLKIEECNLLEYIFPFSALESLKQLKKLAIKDCKAMKMIVKEELGGQTMASKVVVVFPHLNCIELVKLPNLEGFFLGMNDFQWPLLDDLIIKDCPKLTVFTSGQSTAPKLKYIRTTFGKYSIENGLDNFHVTTTLRQTPFSSLDGTSTCPASSKGVPWSFHNLIKLDLFLVSNKFGVKIIPSNELLQLQKLEKIKVWDCTMVHEIIEALDGTDSSFDESQTVVKFPELRKVSLRCLDGLRYIWNNNRWTIYEFPKLTRVTLYGCDKLDYVLTSSMVGSLLQLQELVVRWCDNIEVIVKNANVVVEEKEEESEGKMNELMLPRLKSVQLFRLGSLKGFCLEKNDFSLPSLDVLKIRECPAMTIFTEGNSATPELKEIDTNFGLFHAGEDINSFIKIKHEVGIL